MSYISLACQMFLVELSFDFSHRIGLYSLRTFLRKTSTIQIFFILWLQSENELPMSKMQQNWGVTDFIFKIKRVENYPNFDKSAPQLDMASVLVSWKILKMNRCSTGKKIKCQIWTTNGLLVVFQWGIIGILIGIPTLEKWYISQHLIWFTTLI